LRGVELLCGNAYPNAMIKLFDVLRY